MSFYNREEKYISILSTGELSVRELCEKLFISEATVRRDIAKLREKETVISKRGIIKLNTQSPDKRVPLFVRNSENNIEKYEIARKAAEHIKDGYTLMLDASTTAYYLLSHLQAFKNLLIITNGSKTALEAASMGIRTICTGGELTLESFSFVGSDAEETLRKYNADIAFFSCRGLSENGLATDSSIFENSIRKIMMKNSKESYLLCDKNKIGKKYLNTICNIKDIDGIITN
ncbi:MAG: DeoR/GlpR transcriptional regulator [Clostridia bacterium]|nr:DeoR/GlpR transcriptional regulator [Clostridia bacterium]